jgi:pimeloyl-ACP methyl ester carboxylesterase
MSATTDSERPGMLCLAGFGDNSQIFENLRGTDLGNSYRLLPTDLPGFGSKPALATTTLSALADFVFGRAQSFGARFIMAHSVASIIAKMVAERSEGFIKKIYSLEGNLTAADAYFSGTAAQYDDADEFKSSFLARLAKMPQWAEQNLQRYSSAVQASDTLALWQLGCDAFRFSQENHPGERLQAAVQCHYICNPANCPPQTLNWLAQSAMSRTVINDASHWAPIDRPQAVARAVLNS